MKKDYYEILGVSKKLEKIEPDELREIKASIERVSEAFNASKALFDESKDDFDGKYNKVAQILATFDTLKAQIEEVLKSGTINDSTESLISTYSSKKIVDLFSNTKATLSTLTNALGNKIDTSLKGVANGVATLDNGGTLESTQIPPRVVTLDNFESLVVDVVNTEGFTLGYYVNKDRIVQELGEHNDLIMSQKAVSDALKTKVDITKLKNVITAKQEDVAVTEKAVAEAIEANKGLGIGQAWQNVTSQRQAAVNYTNTTNKAIAVALNNNAFLTIDNQAEVYGAFFIVLPNQVYKINRMPSLWMELR